MSTDRRKSSVISASEKAVTSVLPPGEVVIYDQQLSADEETLAALGYKSVFGLLEDPH